MGCFLRKFQGSTIFLQKESVLPHENIIDKQCLTVSAVKTSTPVKGQTPPLASEPARMAREFAFVVIA